VARHCVPDLERADKEPSARGPHGGSYRLAERLQSAVRTVNFVGICVC
jgi:hypothetical protein